MCYPVAVAGGRLFLTLLYITVMPIAFSQLVEYFLTHLQFIHCKVERFNVEEEGAITYKSDHKTDEEEVAAARQKQMEQNERELMQVNAPNHYQPHVRDQLGLPGFGSDQMTTYAGIAVLSVMAIAMLVVSSRKKKADKSN